MGYFVTAVLLTIFCRGGKGEKKKTAKQNKYPHNPTAGAHLAMACGAPTHNLITPDTQQKATESFNKITAVNYEAHRLKPHSSHCERRCQMLLLTMEPSSQSDCSACQPIMVRDRRANIQGPLLCRNN